MATSSRHTLEPQSQHLAEGGNAKINAKINVQANQDHGSLRRGQPALSLPLPLPPPLSLSLTHNTHLLIPHILSHSLEHVMQHMPLTMSPVPGQPLDTEVHNNGGKGCTTINLRPLQDVHTCGCANALLTGAAGSTPGGAQLPRPDHMEEPRGE
eukprot:scaffold101231_cov17-Tisochrysis_lutea.AAC.1